MTDLKVEEVVPDSHVYMLCKKIVVKVHEKYKESIRVFLFLGQKAAIGFRHGFCKYSNIQDLTLRSHDLSIPHYVRILDHAILFLIMGLVRAAGTSYNNRIMSYTFTEKNKLGTQKSQN